MNTSVNQTTELNTPQPGKMKLTLRRGGDQPELRERLQKVLAGSGLGARRGIEDRIAAGEVLLNGEKAEVGASVGAGDRVLVDGRTFIIKAQEGDYGRVIVYSKPDGEVTTRHDQEGRPTVFDRLPPVQSGRWIVMGDLDINTQGLLLFTSNGELANKIMTSEETFAREYVCRIKGAVTDEILAQLQAGVAIEQGSAAFEEIAKMEHTGNTNEWWRVRIQTGGTKEVKALWEAVGLQLSRLKRISFGPFRLLPGMRRCDVRELPESDVLAMCQDFGITQMPSYLQAEDEQALKLRRNRDSELGKKIILSAGKAEGYWTGERGYGGANVKAQRVSGEFDVDRNKRDKKARKGVKKLSHKQAQIAIGGDGLLSHALEGGQPGQDARRGPSRNAKHRRGVRPPMRPNAGNAAPLAAGQALDAPVKGRQRNQPRQRPRNQPAGELVVNASDVTLDIGTGDSVAARHAPRGNHPRGPHAGPRPARPLGNEPRPARGPKPQHGRNKPEATPGLYEPKERGGNARQDDDNLGNRFGSQPMGDAAAARLLERAANPTANANRFQNAGKGKPKRQFSGPMDHSYEGSQSFNTDFGHDHDDDSGGGNRFNVAETGNSDRQRPDRNGNSQGNGNSVGNNRGRPPMPPRHGPRPPRPPHVAAEPSSQPSMAQPGLVPRPEGAKNRRNKRRKRPRNPANAANFANAANSPNAANSLASNTQFSNSPNEARPPREPNAARPPRDPNTPRPQRNPNAARPPRDPNLVQPPRDPNIAQPARDPNSAPQRRDPNAARPPRPPREPKTALPVQASAPVRETQPAPAPMPSADSAAKARAPRAPKQPAAPRQPRAAKASPAPTPSAPSESAAPAAKSAVRKPRAKSPARKVVTTAPSEGA